MNDQPNVIPPQQTDTPPKNEDKKHKIIIKGALKLALAIFLACVLFLSVAFGTIKVLQSTITKDNQQQVEDPNDDQQQEDDSDDDADENQDDENDPEDENQDQDDQQQDTPDQEQDDNDDDGQEPPTGNVTTVSVLGYGAIANDLSDDTSAFQNAIDALAAASGGTVQVPDGTYIINALTSINMKSNVNLEMSNGAILQASANNSTNYAIVDIVDASNVTISGGKIVGERYIHTGSTGEWGMGINIEDATNVTVSNVYISDCWGDGIYIGSRSAIGYSSNITIKNVTMDNNRRQGISIISVNGLLVEDSVAKNTNGTMPQSGMDLEPNYPTQFLLNVTIKNFHTENNANYGIECWLGSEEENKKVPIANVSVTFINHTDSGSVNGTLHNIQYPLPFYINEGYNFVIN